MPFLKRYAPVLAALWAIVIMVVSVIPSADLPSLSIWEPDKVMHASVYAILTLLVYFALIKLRPYRKRKNIVAAGLCILYGSIIEIIQRLLPTRSFDLLDALANSIGCMLALLVILLISRRNKTEHR